MSAIGPWQGRTLQDTPYSITVIPEEMIQNLQATTPDQIYRNVPTVQFARPQKENDQPGMKMRGFRVQTAYRDGLPADQYGHATTTEDVARVEVFTGLSGFMYGPGNVGGMVNYLSKRPVAERLNRLTAGNNGGGSNYVHGDFGGPFDDAGRLGYRINLVHQEGETAIREERIRKDFISAAFDWKLTDKLLWQFDAGYRNYEVRGIQANWSLARGVVRPSADSINASRSWSQPWSFGQYKTQRYGTNLSWKATDSLTLRAAWQYNNSWRTTGGAASNQIQADGTYVQELDVYAAGDDPMLSEQFDTRGNAFADWRFATGSVAHKLTGGVQYQHSVQERYLNNLPDIVYTGLPLSRPRYFAKPVQASTDRGPRGKVINYSYTTWLLGDDVKFNERWSLLLGAAYSTIDSRRIAFRWPTQPYKKSALTPNLALIYKPVPSLTTYASYIEALEQGGIAADTYRGRKVVNAGQVMTPLRSRQVELGAKATVGGMLLTTAVFEIDRGLQYYDLSTPTAPRYVQDGRQVHRGIEFSAFGKATHDLTLTGGLTWLDPRVRKQKQNPALAGKHPTDVATVTAMLRGEYRMPFLPGLTFNGSINYVGWQYADTMNTDRLPSVTLLDAGLRYETQLMQRLLTFRLDVANLTDKRYWLSGSSIGEPRTVRLSMTADF